MKMHKKIGYATGDMGISLSYFAVGFFFMYYLSDIVGLNPVLAGLAFFIGKLWDGINDPFMGIISDRTRSRFGRKRVYILFGAIPFAISFILLWMIPAGANEWIQFALATLSLLLYSTTYSIVVVPYMAMVPVMSNDYDERTQITGLRAMLSTVGTILGGAAALLVSRFPAPIIGIQTIGIAFAIFTVISLLIAAQSVRGVEQADNRDAAILGVGLKKYLALPGEKNVFVLLMFKFIGAIATSCLTASLPYFAKHILKSEGSSTIGLTIYIATSALFIPVWNRMTHSYDKRKLLLVSNIGAAIILLGIGLVIRTDLIPWFYLACAFLGIVMASYLLIPYSFVPDLVDYYEYKKGERHESVIFGLWMTVHQLGVAVAGLILGTFLGALGYDGNLPTQTDSALFAVRLAFGLIPGVFLIIGAIVLQMYEITRQKYQDIRTELGKRGFAVKI